MAFTTYENRTNPHIAIHRDGCNQLRKRGGEHKDGQDHYVQHATHEDAIAYAQSTGLPPTECSFCNCS